MQNSIPYQQPQQYPVGTLSAPPSPSEFAQALRVILTHAKVWMDCTIQFHTGFYTLLLSNGLIYLVSVSGYEAPLSTRHLEGPVLLSYGCCKKIYHKLGGLKQYKFIIWTVLEAKSPTWASLGSNSRVGYTLLGSSGGESISLPFLPSRGCIVWLMVPSSLKPVKRIRTHYSK